MVDVVHLLGLVGLVWHFGFWCGFGLAFCCFTNRFGVVLCRFDDLEFLLRFFYRRGTDALRKTGWGRTCVWEFSPISKYSVGYSSGRALFVMDIHEYAVGSIMD